MRCAKKTKLKRAVKRRLNQTSSNLWPRNQKEILAASRLCDLGQVRPQSGKHASVPALRRQNALGPCRSPAARKKALSDGAKPLHDLVLQQPQRPARASLRRATMTRRIGDAAGAGSPKCGARNQKIVTSRLCDSRTSTSAVRQADRLRGAAHPVVNIRTSEHHILSRPLLSVSDVRLVGQEARKRILELRCPVTVPREIASLSRMNDDGTNIIVSQQRVRPPASRPPSWCGPSSGKHPNITSSRARA